VAENLPPLAKDLVKNMSQGFREQLGLSRTPDPPGADAVAGAVETEADSPPTEATTGDGAAVGGNATATGTDDGCDYTIEVETLIGNEVLLETGSGAGFFLCHLRDRPLMCELVEVDGEPVTGDALYQRACVDLALRAPVCRYTGLVDWCSPLACACNFTWHSLGRYEAILDGRVRGRSYAFNDDGYKNLEVATQWKEFAATFLPTPSAYELKEAGLHDE
jgi:hypothetical protein